MARTDLQDRQETTAVTPSTLLGHLADYPIHDPYMSVEYLSRDPVRKESLDANALKKLHSAGFAEATLDEIFTRYSLAPLRQVKDLWGILGYETNPGGRHPRFQPDHLTAIALGYPNPAKKAEVYSPNYFVRVRFGTPILNYTKIDGKESVVAQRYAQSLKRPTANGESTPHSEPYFLPVPDAWDDIYNIEKPLWITEGELKAAALALAGETAIGFGGATMWAAPAKSGKHRIHPALDPQGIRAKWAIPIRNRTIFLVPDIDYRSNLMVRKSFLQLAQAIHTAGGNMPYIVHLPPCSAAGEWKGVDDYLLHHCGPSWSGDPVKLARAVSLLRGLRENAELVRLNTIRYKPTSAIRGADRLLERLQSPDRYLLKIVDNDATHTLLGWAMYSGTEYKLQNVFRPSGSTTGKMACTDTTLQRLAEQEYEVGVDEALAEGIDEPPPEMPADYPYRLFSLLDTRIPEVPNDSLLERFANVLLTDTLIRTRDGLINLSTFFKTPLSECWGTRDNWYLLPNHRWVSTGCIQTGFIDAITPPQCPLFLNLLGNATNWDPSRIETLQLFLGKIVCNPLFVGSQQFLALYGQPGSGKGTIIRLILQLIGDKAVAELRPTLGNRFESGHLPGKRLVVFHETPDGHRTGDFAPEMSNLVKQITGQDRVLCEAKGRQPVPHYINAEVIVVGETPPALGMHADAFRRRAVFLGFSSKIEAKDFRVEALMVREELPGIFWWALQGAHKLWNQPTPHIMSPAKCLEDLEDVSFDVSPVDRFISEMIIRTDVKEDVLSLKTIQEAYENWCIEHRVSRSIVSGVRRISYAIRHRFGVETTVTSSRSGDGSRSARVFRGFKLKQASF